MNSYNRIIWLDFVRFFACISVIVLHISGSYVVNTYNSNYHNWMFGNILDSFSRACVPLFFMISGFLFLSDREPKNKHLIKVILSLFFYSVIGFIANYIYYLINMRDSFPSFNLLEKPIFFHLWFFYMLIPIYLFMMIIKVRQENAKKILFIIPILFIFFNIKSNNLTTLFGINVKNNFMFVDMFSGCFMYAILGGAFNFIVIKKEKLINSLSLLFFILSSSLIAFLTNIISDNEGKTNVIFYGYTTPLVFLSSISIFLFFFTLSKNTKEIKIVSHISNYSLGIYGFHAVILSFIIDITKYYNYNPLWFFCVFFTTLLVSIILTKTVRFFDKKNILS
ncbi:acyltransferase [Proteus penneri]|uniref:acyltransferase n=1 Tax=Proteus penneri TaxID=102862 RepID=UPI001EFAA382|nr:acyltransferase family protein [Proteus penneri]